MKKPLSSDKLRGGYYTPPALARFLARWAIRSSADRVLEPSCGDGRILAAAADRFSELGGTPNALRNKLLGVELLETESRKAARTGATVVTADFFAFFQNRIENGGKTFDCAIGNPPFVRYQNFDAVSRDTAFALLRARGFNPNRLTNAWMPFLVLSAFALAPDGRLAMVIPAELLQVDYASEIRKFLAGFFQRTTIVLFRSIVFEGIQQEVVLLLCERSANTSGVRTLEVENVRQLEKSGLARLALSDTIPCLPDGQKWTRFLLSSQENALLDQLAQDPRISPATDLFEVNVGLVSGENDFFVLSRNNVEEHGLGDAVLPIVSRAEQVRGIRFGTADFAAMSASGKRMYLFNPDERPLAELPSAVRDYIVEGEARKFHENYKCRIRTPWYRVPMSWTADAFLTRQVNAYPRMVLNDKHALVTDTLHKIRFRDALAAQQIACAFLNSYTFALSETLGRSYGGGVMTFEPGEVRKMRIPLLGAEQLSADLFDTWIRAGKIGDILNETDRILLEEGLGLAKSEILMLRGIWEKLRDRRIARKSKTIDSELRSPLTSQYTYAFNDTEQLLLVMESKAQYGKSKRAGNRRSVSRTPKKRNSKDIASV